MRWILILLVSGCALQPPQPPETRTTTVEVKVPVPTPCFTEDERPKLPPPTPVAVGATADQIAAAEQADLQNERLFALAVDALFIKCMGAPK